MKSALHTDWEKMITVEEYSKLVDELLVMEKELERLGNVTVDTSQGQYAMFEMQLSDRVKEQKEYNDLFKVVKQKQRLVDAFDQVARYKLSLQS